MAQGPITSAQAMKAVRSVCLQLPDGTKLLPDPRDTARIWNINYGSPSVSTIPTSRRQNYLPTSNVAAPNRSAWISLDCCRVCSHQHINYCKPRRSFCLWMLARPSRLLQCAAAPLLLRRSTRRCRVGAKSRRRAGWRKPPAARAAVLNVILKFDRA